MTQRMSTTHCIDYSDVGTKSVKACFQCMKRLGCNDRYVGELVLQLPIAILPRAAEIVRKEKSALSGIE